MSNNNYEYFLSSQVKIFPCAQRGSGFDPESKQVSEYNFTHLPGILPGKTSYKLSFSNEVLCCVIAGYYIEISGFEHDSEKGYLLLGLKDYLICEGGDNVELNDASRQSFLLHPLDSDYSALDTVVTDTANNKSKSLFTALAYSELEPDPSIPSLNLSEAYFKVASKQDLDDIALTPGKTPQLHINSQSNEWEVSYDEGGTWTSLKVKATGANGADGKDGEDGKDGVDGENGADGAPGKDGLTPYIGENGNWWIGDTDTGVKAAGDDGKDGANGADGKNGSDGKDGVTPTIEISEDGYWIIDGAETEYKAIGVDGKNGVDGKDGVTSTIEISDDGYWVINSQKTEHKAIGQDGTNGLTPVIGENGNWWIGTKDTGIKAAGVDGTPLTHEWVGTELKVTSASGTSSADLKGIPGNRGSIWFTFSGNLSAGLEDGTLYPAIDPQDSDMCIDINKTIFQYRILEDQPKWEQFLPNSEPTETPES